MHDLASNILLAADPQRDGIVVRTIECYFQFLLDKTACILELGHVIYAIYLRCSPTTNDPDCFENKSSANL